MLCPFWLQWKAPGEAKAKSELFDYIYSELKLAEAEYVDVGPNARALDKAGELKVRPDFGFRREGKIYHVLVYPNSEPALKKVQKEAIIAALAQPISLTEEEYKFCLVEYPRIGNKRSGNLEVFPFEYRELSDDFLRHIQTYYEELDANRPQGDLFG